MTQQLALLADASQIEALQAQIDFLAAKCASVIDTNTALFAEVQILRERCTHVEIRTGIKPKKISPYAVERI